MRGTTPVRGPSSLRFGCWRRPRDPQLHLMNQGIAPRRREPRLDCCTPLLHTAGPPDAEDASEAFADVGQASDVAAAAAAAAGGYGALRVDAARPLLEAAALAADWASRACVAAAAKATRETQQACMNRGDATQASKAQQAADDADASLDEGLAPVLEAWAHASTDASLVDAGHAAVHVDAVQRVAPRRRF